MAPEANEGIERIQLEGVEPWTSQSIAVCRGVTASVGAVTGDGTSRLVVVILDPDVLEGVEVGGKQLTWRPYGPYSERLEVVEATLGARHVSSIAVVFGKGEEEVVVGRISVVLEASEEDLARGLSGLMPRLLPPASPGDGA